MKQTEKEPVAFEIQAQGFKVLIDKMRREIDEYLQVTNLHESSLDTTELM